MVRFAGTPGQDPEARLDMRLLEFRLTTQDPGGQGQSATLPPPTEEPHL